MKTFLKRNKMIKLFTIGWIIAMIGLATVFLLMTPSEDDENAEVILVSKESELGVTVIEVPSSALLNQVIIVDSSYSTFISIANYNMSCAVIITGKSIESSRENINCGTYILQEVQREYETFHEL
jgi:hypothetical protein